jgi:dTDP-4-amino-4,6-dideoxygalactose transaminase
MRGAIPVVADIDRESQTLTADTIRPRLTATTRAIVCVHLAGWPCDMDPILALASEHGLKIVEDCAQAHGATYKGRPVGSLGNIAAFSFCQDKIMSTGGEGGMVTTNDATLWERAWSFKDHGKNYQATHDSHPAPGFRYLHDCFGTNWRMTELQAAIGRVLLEKLPGFLAIRRQYARLLDEAFSHYPALRVTTPPAWAKHSYYKYYVFVRPQCLKRGWTRDRIIASINAEGIPCFSGACPEIYLEKAFDSQQQPHGRLPVATELGETSLLFLLHPTLSAADIFDTVRAVGKVMAVASA